MSTRGRRDPGAKTETLCALGRFGVPNSSIRKEFLAAIKN
jgi:GTP cyclohydrolase I